MKNINTALIARVLGKILAIFIGMSKKPLSEEKIILEAPISHLLNWNCEGKAEVFERIFQQS